MVSNSPGAPPENPRRKPQPYNGVWTRRAVDVDEWLRDHKIIVSATSASLLSTFTGFPLDSLKSRLQSSRNKASIPRLAAKVIKEEGVGGLWRGFPLPLVTISIVRTVSFTIYTATKRVLNVNSSPAPTSEVHSQGVVKEKDGNTRDEKKPWVNIQLGMYSGDNAKDIAMTSLMAGAASGAIVCLGSAPFELVKVRRQLEYQIYQDSHPELARDAVGSSASSATSAASSPSTSAYAGSTPKSKTPPFKAPTTTQAVRLIINSNGPLGLYTGWRLHFIRDTLGTALYFAEYDVMRYYLGRAKTEHEGLGGTGVNRYDDIQGDLPDWANGWLPKGMVPFLCGSLAGVTSWALIYPVDAIKTKHQQRVLSGLPARSPFVQLQRLVRGTDVNHPKPFWSGIARLYRGLGISMVRSMLTHGLLWTIIDTTGNYIETRPFERLAGLEVDKLS